MAKQTGDQIVQDSHHRGASQERRGSGRDDRKPNVDALAETGNASRAAVQELTKAYQELTTKNVRNVTAAMQALAGVKSPTDFIELQQKLIKEGVETAVGDSQRIAQLTTAVFACGTGRSGSASRPCRTPRTPKPSIFRSRWIFMRMAAFHSLPTPALMPFFSNARRLRARTELHCQAPAILPGLPRRSR